MHTYTHPFLWNTRGIAYKRNRACCRRSGTIEAETIMRTTGSRFVDFPFIPGCARRNFFFFHPHLTPSSSAFLTGGTSSLSVGDKETSFFLRTREERRDADEKLLVVFLSLCKRPAPHTVAWIILVSVSTMT